MDRGDVQKLLDDFAGVIGLQGLVLDDTGRIALTVDEALVIDIEHDDEEDILLLSAEVAALGAKPEHQQLVDLLRGNYDFDETEGASLALHGVDNVVHLQRTMRLEGLVVGEVARVFEIFMVTAEDWTARLADLGESESKPAAPPAVPDGAIKV